MILFENIPAAKYWKIHVLLAYLCFLNSNYVKNTILRVKITFFLSQTTFKFGVTFYLLFVNDLCATILKSLAVSIYSYSGKNRAAVHCPQSRFITIRDPVALDTAVWAAACYTALYGTLEDRPL